MPIVDKFCPQSIMVVVCYDKVSLWMGKSFTPSNIDIVARNLDGGIESKDINTGNVIVSGYKKGLKVSFYQSGISITGSLPKFLYNDNIHPLNRKTTKEAIEAISDALKLDISDAKTTGLEFGFNFPVKYPVADYLLRLGELKGLQRYKFSDTTLYFKPKGKKHHKVLCFYDKKAEARSNGVAIPVGLEDTNLLKYELRLKGSLSSLLGVPYITASTLSERDFYKMLIGLYQSNYRAIYKQKKGNDMNCIKSPNDAITFLLGRFLNEGEQGKIDEFINELKSSGVFKDKDRNSYYRVRKGLQEALDMAGGGLEDEIIKELDNDIENLGAYI